MKKILFTLFISFFVLAGCSGSNVKTQPSITLPYEITNEEVQAFKEEGLEYYTDYQELKAVVIRDLTSEENEALLKQMEGNTLNDLNSEYSAIEFNFGYTERINKVGNTIYKFDEGTSKFIYDNEILNSKFYQVETKRDESVRRFDEDRNEEGIYGEICQDFKIVTLLEKEFIKDGLQFKTTINDEIVYINIY